MQGRAVAQVGKLAVADALDTVVAACCSQHRVLRMDLIGTIDVARPGVGDGVVVAGAALRGDQVVETVSLEDMRGLGHADRAAVEDLAGLPDQALLCVIVLLHQNAAEQVRWRLPPGKGRAVIPDHVEQVFAAIVIVEQGRVKAGIVQVDAGGPRTVDRGRGGQVVGRILVVAVKAADVCVDQPEQAVGVTQRRRPDPAAVGIAAHVQLVGAAEWSADKRPVFEVARMVNLHARVPFEGRGREVEILADLAQAGIGVEAAQNRVLKGHGWSPDADSTGSQVPKPARRIARPVILDPSDVLHSGHFFDGFCGLWRRKPVAGPFFLRAERPALNSHGVWRGSA
ncbi:MAG: Uncharacterised protein [Rhodospirillaceae bacterium]|nr:MAG: Uncharacterised protein [Rhodospirillaceae bacterium]